MSVDLEALKAELDATGIKTFFGKRDNGQSVHGSYPGAVFAVTAKEAVRFWGDVDPNVYDIIRRHLAGDAARTEEGG